MSSIDYSINSSLSSPNDKDRNLPNTFKLGSTLKEEEVKDAMKELYVSDAIRKFPRFEKFYADPQIPNQNFCLVSFVPAKGARPDETGCYGMAKVRGIFATEQEADLQAERLIRNVDCYHNIFNCWVGRPFPLTKDKRYIQETKEIDLSKKVTEVESQEIRKIRDDETKIMNEIQERQKELLEDVKEDKTVDKLDQYIECNVKAAHLKWTFTENIKKLRDIKSNIKKAKEIITKMDEEDPSYKELYFERYKQARKRSGLPSTDDSFMKYLAEDINIEDNIII